MLFATSFPTAVQSMESSLPSSSWKTWSLTQPVARWLWDIVRWSWPARSLTCCCFWCPIKAGYLPKSKFTPRCGQRNTPLTTATYAEKPLSHHRLVQFQRLSNYLQPKCGNQHRRAGALCRCFRLYVKKSKPPGLRYTKRRSPPEVGSVF